MSLEDAAAEKPKCKFHLHLVSDATGTTLLGLARACLAQFEGIEPIQKFWPLIRTKRQLERVIKRIEEAPGPVIFTLVDKEMRERLQERCDEMGVPCIPVLDPIMRGLSSYLGQGTIGVPGLQHAMDDAYFRRVSAIDFALRFDDGKTLSGLKEADVVLVGVSRTSKTPTSIYLARRGIKVANIPIVPGVEIPKKKLTLEKPLYVGLSASADRLMQIRRTRLKSDSSKEYPPDLPENQYLDLEKIEDEVKAARRMFGKHGWPVIDVTKRSIEETSAEIMALLQTRKDKQLAADE